MKLKITYFRILLFAFIIFSIIGFKRNTETEKITYKHSNQVNNQVHPIADMIAKKKQEGASFKPFSIFSLNNSEIPASLSSFVKNATVLKLSSSSLADINNAKPNSLNFIIPVNNGKNFELELTQVNIFTDEYARKHPTGQGMFYHGIIKGDMNSIASINIFDNWVEGIISNDDGNYVLGPIKDNDNRNTPNYILYNDANLLVKNNFRCKTDDFKMDKGSSRVHKVNPNPGNNVNTTQPIKVYFVADYQMYLDNNQDTAIERQFINAIFANSQAIYSNEPQPIPRVISDVNMYMTPDPYRTLYTSDTNLMLFAYNIQDNFNGDLAQLLSTYHGDSLGGIAWINVLCASYNPADFSGRYSYCNIANSYMAYPVYSWTVEEITHEMGHNIACKHTQACVWPVFTGGGTGAIDSCYTAEGNCFSQTQANYNGTIMSYCHLNGAIDFNNGFGRNLPYGDLPDDTLAAGYASALCIDNALNISDRPVTYSLLQNYPNPFNPSTNIKFALPNDGYVSLSLYDVAGREVARLINNQYYNYGIYSFSVDGNNYRMASGVYLYRLRVNSSNGQTYSDIKKMVYIK